MTGGRLSGALRRHLIRLLLCIGKDSWLAGNGKRVMTRRPFLISGILGLGAVVMTLIFNLVGPQPAAPLPHGFITPVLAFEFARDEADVAAIFAHQGQPAADVRASMDRLNRLDFLYIGLYGGCLIAFALTCARLSGQRVYTVAAILAVAVMAADVLENLQLLGITRELGVTSIDDNLAWLRLFTWLKWGGLALWFLLVRPWFQGQTGWVRAIGLAALLPLLLAVVAFIRPGLASELFALSIGVLFLLLTVYALRFQLPASAAAPA